MHTWQLKQEYQSSEGVVAYDLFGEGPPVILVHGTPSWSYLWRNIVPVLAKHWTVYVYDLIGYGTSEKREGQDVSIPAQTRIFVELLEHWQLTSPSVAGHDIGAAIVLRAHLLENRHYSHLSLIDAVAIAPWITPFSRHVQKYLEAFQTVPAHIHVQMTATHIRTAIHRPMDDNAIKAYLSQWLGEAGQASYYRQLARLDENDTREIEPLYGNIKLPTLILWGEQDAWLHRSIAERLHKAIPHSKLKLISNAGHFAQEDAPNEVAQALEEFFSQDS